MYFMCHGHPHAIKSTQFNKLFVFQNILANMGFSHIYIYINYNIAGIYK